MHLKEPIDATSPDQTPSTTSTSTSKPPPPPVPTPRPLYFAYGSNLSPTQMRRRCTHSPEHSSRPLAIARLPRWKWFICEAGYANVLPPGEFRIGRQKLGLKYMDESTPSSTNGNADEDGEDGEEDEVYGVLYEMHPADEFLLDGYEGVDHGASLSRHSDKVGVDIRPREQGLGDYNKWLFPAVVTRWLDEDEMVGRSASGGNQDGDVQTVLVYVDEERVSPGPPKKEYIARMNRGIREAEELGFPADWVEVVMRRFIPEFDC